MIWKTIEFFCNILGAAKLKGRKEFAGAKGASLDMAGSPFYLRVARDSDKMAGDSTELRFSYDHIGLEAENLDETFEHLKAKGVVFTMVPTELSNLCVKISFVKGPDNINV